MIVFACLALHTKALSQHSSPDTIITFFSEKEILLDGVLNESVWEQAMHISNFTQRELNVNQPATERTEVALVYTEKTLYIGIWCYDREADKIVARELKRDFEHSREDNFEVIIDTYHDKRNGFLFIINPNAARKDAQVLDNGESFNVNWNGVWNVKTTISDKGWFAEMQIPFSTLKFRSGLERQVWGINFERNIRRKREQLLWQGWSRDSELEFVNRAGTLVGLNQVASKAFVEVKPYSIGGVQLEGDNDKGIFNLGGDVNYLVTPTLRLNLTVNTDFAQVESDRQQINLTRFPLFFPERREFFLEGQDYFDMGLGERIIPFYSRRIGLNENRQTVPILAGVRLLGKVNNSTIGAMSIQTAEQDGINGDVSTPTSNYTVLSWRQDVLKQSTVGIMSTNKYVNGRLHSTTGGYARYSTANLFGNKNLVVGASYARNYNSDSLSADASAHRVFVSYPNDRIQFDAAWSRNATNFNPEVGFLSRSNFQEFYTELEFKPRPKNFLRWIRQFSLKPLDMNYFIYDNTGKLQSFSYEIRPLGFETRSGEFFEFNIQRRAEGLQEPFEIRDSIIIPEGDYWQTRYEIQAETFSSRVFSFGTAINWGKFYNGKSVESELGVNWRANRYFNVNMIYEHNWVNLPEGSFQTNLISNRIEYAISPNVFGSFFTQWNNEDEEVILNYRLQIIPKIGADFFFIVNQLYDTSGKQWKLAQTVVIGKLIWRFAL
ncbi:DUF5916 domain-containing protein [Rhodocytophaga aerolata]|uniref:DUF5916 domain-containing protein n=1 Tax=Rhodocytophaga aerolata TaxID=455078 RepID=A0ABT8RBX4_9BACT|nr:DUF5916 domain-containing protein [Rhodocytophaga aerolata]MDO1449602.1 DUF5916 domain-containing protein [Rhodocytophaga aerolata]